MSFTVQIKKAITNAHTIDLSHSREVSLNNYLTRLKPKLILILQEKYNTKDRIAINIGKTNLTKLNMNYIENESTLRYLRKQHKDWSEDKIKEEAQKIWDKYVEDNKERLEKQEKKDREAFEKSLDKEHWNFIMDNYDKLK